MWMDESRRESRFPTRTNPSSRERRERSVNPRNWVRKVSQYLTRNVPSILRFLFSIEITLVIAERKNEAGIASFYALIFRTFSTLVIRSCGLNGLAM